MSLNFKLTLTLIHFIKIIRSPIQVIISLRNDMILEEKQTKAPFGAAGTRGSQGKGRKLELSFLHV
jgi:hypothetical protein